MGGVAFSLSMLWAQVMPFVALWLWGGGDEEDVSTTVMTIALIGSFCAWLLLNVIFFCTIDLSYLNTFFGTKTAAEYTCERFLTSEEDNRKWAAAFENRIEYKKAIKGEVKNWVAENIARWRMEKPDFFKVEMIPDEYLPAEVLVAEGGAKRRRSSVSIREMVGFGDGGGEASGVKVHPSS